MADVPALTYPEVGATAGDLPSGYHHLRVARVVGHGREAFERAADALLAGEVQRRSGVRTTLSQTPLRVGTRVAMRLRLGPLVFAAPCRVIDAGRTADACWFAYGTLPGHPESGEERFTVRLDDDGAVWLEIVAFSRPARWFTRLGAPLGRAVQARTTRRYLRALDAPAAGTMGR